MLFLSRVIVFVPKTFCYLLLPLQGMLDLYPIYNNTKGMKTRERKRASEERGGPSKSRDPL